MQPTAFTLNALLNVEMQTGRPKVAVSLLRRAERGSPRWPGEPPDAWSYTTAMAAAGKARQPREVSSLFGKLTSVQRLQGEATVAAYNMAIAARLRLGDRDGARALLGRMLDLESGAPAPQADTFNAMLAAVCTCVRIAHAHTGIGVCACA